MRDPVPSITLAALVLAALGTTATAQRTWIVDTNNGAGTDFTDLPPAVAAAAPGDSILVRAGNYSTPTISKTLTVFGDGAVSVGLMRVANLHIGDVVTLEGITALGLEVVDNDGRVHAEECAIDPVFPTFGKLLLRNSRLMTANGCDLVQAEVTRSTLLLTGCVLAGNAVLGATTMNLSNADVVLTDCQVFGSDAFCPFGVGFPPTPAISVNGNSLTLSGDRCAIRAGMDSAQCVQHPPIAAIGCGGNTAIRYDTGVTLAGTNGGATIDGFCTRSAERIPAVTAVGAPPGGTLNSDVYAPAGTLSVLLLSEATFDTPTPFGQLWLATVNVAIDGGVIGVTEHRTHGLAVGASWPRGLAVTLQAATLPQTGPVALSQPVVVTLE